MHILKLEPFSGISGDMFLGAVAPLADAEKDLEALPARLGLQNVSVSFENVIRSTIQCRKAHVRLSEKDAKEADEAPHHHHHHHHDHPHGHSHDHGDHHHHGHEHVHTHAHSHTHRAYTDIVALIENADLPASVKVKALEMFRYLGEAEAEMHGMPLEKVHFHEVGGEDAIVDLVGAAWLIDKLSPLKVYCTPVCTGSGTVRTAHGRLPVPAPATQKLLEGMPAFPGPVEKEMTTPSGAAILRALNPDFSTPVLRIRQSGMGAGTRDIPSQPNALRAALCEAGEAETSHQAVSLLQTNLDNLPAEDLGADLLASLIEAGAMDAWLSPVIMKKGRPAQKLEVLCAPAGADALRTWILNRLPTLGVRQFDGFRQILERGTAVVETRYGRIRVKEHRLPDGTVRRLPESADCIEAAARGGVSVHEVRQAAAAATG